MSVPEKNVVLCLDGTWNDPRMEKERDDGTKVLKPTNVLKTSRAVAAWDESTGRAQVAYYRVGVGAQGKYPGGSNRVVGWVDSKLGGAWGAGFERNVEAALTFLVDNHEPGDTVYVFGFSRGAAEARGLTRFIDWLGGIPTKRDAYFLPLYFRHYVVTEGKGDPASVKTSSGNGPSEPLESVDVAMLGVWDTVMALPKQRSFHVAERPATCVGNARHAIAIDERRFDFRPEVWLGCAPQQTLEQRWYPGVHSNVGGGYVNDGLANLSLRWMLGEAESCGLAIDRRYSKFFRPYPQDTLHSSKTMVYKFLDGVRFKSKKGVRPLVGYSADASLSLDKSAIHRICAQPGEQFPELDGPYRPENVFAYLAQQSDLPAYLASLGLEGEAAQLPKDVLKKIAALR